MATSTDDNEADGNSGKNKVEIIWRRGTGTVSVGFPDMIKSINRYNDSGSARCFAGMNEICCTRRVL